MRKGIQKDRTSRHRPVSCHFCRSRKLRCSRQFPCPNCTSRGIDCQLYGSKAETPAYDTNANYNQNESEQSSLDILKRLNRLEKIVLKPGWQTSSPSTNTTLPRQSQQLLHNQQESLAVVNDAELIERECMDQTSQELSYHHQIVFKISPIREISNRILHTSENSAKPSDKRQSITYVQVPEYTESMTLVECYLGDITFAHHVVHPASVRADIEIVYRNLNDNKVVKYGQLALLLSILASTTFLWTVRDNATLFSSVEDANNLSKYWVRATLNVLDYSRQTSFAAIEDIQAMIIISFVLSNLEGMSPRYWSSISSAIMMARELSLHRIDHPANPTTLNLPSPNSVRAEIARRVWWYLVATDWVLSRYVGPQESLYSINPNHMAVRLPRNIDDENLNDEILNDEMALIEQPHDQPTSLSYFLHRIRFAEVCRELTDNIPLGISSSEASVHSHIMKFDAKIDDLIENLPSFFRLHVNHHDEMRTLNSEQIQGLIIQKYILNSMIYAHRCKLHVRYLSQSATDSAYARSRQICLNAARMIIKTENFLERQDITFALRRLKFSGSLYCIFMAVIVLLLDFCFNKNTTNEDAAREEVMTAWNILEKAKDQSTVASKLLNAMRKVVRKHRINLPNVEEDSQAEMSSSNRATVSCIATNDGVEILRGSQDTDSGDPVNIDNDQPVFLDEIWSSFEDGIELGTLDWDTILSELGSQI